MNIQSKIRFLAIAFIALSMFAIHAQSETPKTSGLSELLVKDLSLKPEQATGAAGSVFSLAKSKMPAADFSKLAGGFPEMDSLLKAAPAVSTGSNPLSSALGSLSGPAALASQFKTLGISPETATKIVPEVLNFVKGKQGTEMMDLLSKAIK